MSLQTCMRARGREDERWSTLWFPLTYFPSAGITLFPLWHNAENNISSHSSAETVSNLLAPSSCVSLAGPELWHRRLTSALSGVDWGSCSAQLEIQQIYLEHEDKVVHLENDCDSGQPWCPLQHHRTAWPGSVYWTRLNPQPRFSDSSSVRGLYLFRLVESCLSHMNYTWIHLLKKNKKSFMSSQAVTLWNYAKSVKIVF